MRFIVLIFLFCSLLYSCDSTGDDANYTVESALIVAGNNRAELEKVLRHYQDDSLKYEAACYLIRYMPYHYGHTSVQTRKAKAVMGKLFEQGDLMPQQQAAVLKMSLNQQKDSFLCDVEHITAEQLVENIDFAFKVWHEKPWNKYLDFEAFCETLLPYRVGFEFLELWRKNLYERYNPILDSLYQGTDVVEAANALSSYMGSHKKVVFDSEWKYVGLGANFLSDTICGSCQDIRDYLVLLPCIRMKLLCLSI